MRLLTKIWKAGRVISLVLAVAFLTGIPFPDVAEAVCGFYTNRISWTGNSSLFCLTAPYAGTYSVYITDARTWGQRIYCIDKYCTEKDIVSVDQRCEGGTDDPPETISGNGWGYTDRLVGTCKEEKFNYYSWAGGYFYTLNSYQVLGIYYKDKCEGGAKISSIPQLVGQCDGRWDDLPYDGTSSAICDKGCALASLNMLMNSEGCYPDFLDTNNCPECFDPSGNVDWGAAVDAYCGNTYYIGKTDYNRKFKKVSEILKPEMIREGLKSGFRYVLNVRGSDDKCSHFVFLTGISSDCQSFNVLDPNMKVSSVTEICGYRKFK